MDILRAETDDAIGDIEKGCFGVLANLAKLAAGAVALIFLGSRLI